MIGLLLLSVSAIVYVFALASGQDSIFEYTLLLACLTFALLLNNDFELISPAVLFTAYFLYSIALGPIGLMNMGRFYSYGYTKIILGGLLAFAIGNGICLIAKKRPVHEKEDKPKIRFSFSRIKTLYFLLAVSWSTPIEEIPATIQEKAKLFSRVYREAKQKGVLECPHYRSIFIDEVLANLPKGEVC